MLNNDKTYGVKHARKILYFIIVLCRLTNIMKYMIENLYMCMHVVWKILLTPGKLNVHLCMCKIEHCLENKLQPNFGSQRTMFLSNLMLSELKFDKILEL